MEIRRRPSQLFYVREWGIGLRIEDNVLVTANGCENLSAAIPATIDEI
jgi:Xaa-Pro aminopeptidase